MERNETLKFKWYKAMRDRIRLSIPESEVSNAELKKYLDGLWQSKIDYEGRFYNTTTNENRKMTVEQFVDMFLTDEHSLSMFGCLYKNQNTGVLNLFADAVQFLLDERDRYKKIQKNAPHGSSEYFLAKRNQSSVKIITNSIYGCIGMVVSALYDASLQNSITKTGQVIISTAIQCLEAFAADNVEFDAVDDVINFISNVQKQTYDQPITKFVDVIPAEQVIDYLDSKCLKKTVMSRKLITSIINNMDDELRTRIYYKNHLLELTSSPNFIKALNSFIKAREPFKELSTKATYQNWVKLVMDFVFYEGLYNDRFHFMNTHTRKAVLVSDTDSAFLYVQPVVDHFADKLEIDLSDEDQEMLLINIFIDIFVKCTERTFAILCDNMGIPPVGAKNIYMKNEFVYKKLMTTENKKSYAGLCTAELGVVLPKDKQYVDIKGLSIKKSTAAKKIRDTFTDILEQDILGSDTIDVGRVLKKYSALEEDIKQSLMRGELTYAIPKSISSPEEYKNPDRIDGFRGTVVWNELYPDDKIIAPDRAYLVKLEPFSKLKSMLYDKYRRECDIIQRIMDNGINVGKGKVDISKFDCDVICIPIDHDVMPEFITHLVNYADMVATNMSNGMVLLKQLGIFVSNKNNVQKKSNIIIL